jgi:hypothetical protein
VRMLTLKDFYVHHFQRGCPVLAFFARAGIDAVCANWFFAVAASSKTCA